MLKAAMYVQCYRVTHQKQHRITPTGYHIGLVCTGELYICMHNVYNRF